MVDKKTFKWNEPREDVEKKQRYVRTIPYKIGSNNWVYAGGQNLAGQFDGRVIKLVPGAEISLQLFSNG